MARAPEPVGPANRNIHFARKPPRSIWISVARGGHTSASLFRSDCVPARVRCNAIFISDPSNRRRRTLKDSGIRLITSDKVSHWNDGGPIKPNFNELAVTRKDLCQLFAIQFVIPALKFRGLALASVAGSEMIVSCTDIDTQRDSLLPAGGGYFG